MIRRSVLVLALALVLSAGLAAPAFAGNIAVEQAWARATAPNAPNGAVFMTIRNAGAEADRLVSAASGVAARVELHTHRMEGDVMKMRPVEAIDIPAHGEAVLRPGSLHVMMFGLAAPLAKGGTFPVDLTFEKAGPLRVDVTVMGAGATGPAGAGHGAGNGDARPMHGSK